MVSLVNPDSGVAGDQVSIEGSGFSGATGLSFGDVWANTWSIVSDTEITATVPEPAAYGPVIVAVTRPADMSADQVLFTYYGSPEAAAPIAASVQPNCGCVGDAVVITGSGLSICSNVTFGDTAAEFTIEDDTHLSAMVPEAEVSGEVAVVVTTSAGVSSEPVPFFYET